MGYLLHIDILGFSQALSQDADRASAILRAFEEVCESSLDSPLPGGISLDAGTKCRLIILNDSAFFYSETFDRVVHYSSNVASRLMQISDRRGGPIAVRGAVARTSSRPRLDIANAVPPHGTTKVRLIVDNIGGALIAEKRQLLGARIVFPSSCLDGDEFRRWDLRLQARVMEAAHSPRVVGSDLLAAKEFAGYLDIAWMNIDSNERFEGLATQVTKAWRLGAIQSRTALHGSATMALYEATKDRRHGIVVVLRKLWVGARHHAGRDLKEPARDDYARWLRFGELIRAKQPGGVELPVWRDQRVVRKPVS
jgi:hypothetical protein